MRGFNQSELPLLILKGISNASRDYLMSNDGWLWRAPEYWVTVSIAKELIRGIGKNKRVISLESSVSQTLTNAGAKQRGPKKRAIRANGRFDIVIGQGNERPRSVVEVKSPLFDSTPNKGVLDDFSRLASVLKHAGSKSNISSAIFAFYSDQSEPTRKDASAKVKILRKFGKGREFEKHVSESEKHLSDFEKHVKVWSEKNGVHYEYYVSSAQYEVNSGARIWGCVVFTRLKKLVAKPL